MSKTRMRSTFSFKKLANKLNNIIANDLNVIGKNINKAIQDGISQGKDIHGSNFTALQPITKELGGDKILKRSGKMSKTSMKQAKPNDLKFVITAPTKYGAYHNTGFTQTNPKQWFHGAKVPQREWFGIPKSIFPGEAAYEKAIAERSLRMRSAWKK